jgi:uncharacterized repeat protein (TIGR01451 family)
LIHCCDPPLPSSLSPNGVSIKIEVSMFDRPGVRSWIAGLVFFLGLSALLGLTLMAPNQVNAQTAPNLGTAASFAVLAGSTVTNTGSSVVNGDLGVSPGSAVTGFPPGTVTPPGTIHAADAVALQAQTDVTTAYDFLAGQTPCTDLTGQDLGGLTLTAGVYCFSTSAQLTGQLTLDAAGNADAVFVFQIGSTLTTASASSVIVTNGGSVCNVWWQVGSSATLGTTTSFAGNILALDSITLTTGANISGRALARNAAVTMDTNTVGSAACIPLAAPNPALSLTKDDGGVTVAPGGVISYTLNYQNTGNVALNNVTLTDAIPADTTFNAGASTPGWNCGVSPCTFDLGTLAPGASGSAIFAVTVNSPTGATVISNGATITSGATSATASDTTPVIPPTATTVPTDAPPGATAVPPTAPPDATAVPPDLTAVATQTLQALLALTPNPAQTNTGSQTVRGLPNTGGAPPQPTYWIARPGR